MTETSTAQAIIDKIAARHEVPESGRAIHAYGVALARLDADEILSLPKVEALELRSECWGKCAKLREEDDRFNAAWDYDNPPSESAQLAASAVGDALAAYTLAATILDQVYRCREDQSYDD